jgi:flagellum-specific peptidoglycan hydrolase FlgJ
MTSIANGIIQSSAFLNLTQTAFIALIGPLAQQDYHKSGVLASVTLAQAINESGWGKTELAQKGNNIFGMKISLSGNTWSGSVWDGKSYVSIRTTEEYGGKKTKITAKFRKYKSVTDSIADHSAYLVNAMNGSKRRYTGLTATKKYSEQLKILQKGGYCTWSSYVSELTSLIKKYKLTQYDK